MCLGGIVTCLPFFVCAFNPKISMLLAVVMGAVLGAPLFILGFHLQFKSSSDRRTARRFLPKPSEVWGIIGCFTFVACLLIPFFVFFKTADLLLPAEDTWANVVPRLLFLVPAAFGLYWWFYRFAPRAITALFRGKISDEVLDRFLVEKPKEEPSDVVGAMLMHWKLPVIAVVALCVGIVFFNFYFPELHFDENTTPLTGRARAHARMVGMVQDNPKTVLSISVLIAVGTLGLFIYQILHAAMRARR